MGNCCSSTRVKGHPNEKKYRKTIIAYEEELAFANPLARGVSTAGTGQMSVLSSLPDSSKKAHIHSVYDGDTLTIVQDDGSLQKVRLIGIDTPELAPREPFAVESTNFVKKHCPPGSEVWLFTSTDPKNQYDKYKRLLAYIFVAKYTQGSGYLCINVALVLDGLAFFYAPHGSDLLERRDLLLSAQRLAIQKRRNIWSIAPLQQTVYVTRNGIAFHRDVCFHIKRFIKQTTLEEAARIGLSPCRTCQPLG
ncbi:unnamed protein product [Phytomonas sp. EM1]|nr:unnamed protein product [Phytomonas sp. EM1]|eukprot:CCW61064.1 unnamed protein product [Phytomonas sp. isolate EM1]